ncbi:DUF2336 domain-containing protein [Lichenihabitans sp. Uapishka_5]|uniref:DUF2336 domain-containing protein n=1 Tax=Lichenihabitans sp. Uapishka_5 TaxID=3037302 RepID=UPI0029E7FD7D|nr:DUF2336 domain-containing protein [Lichenihabitans sp. Uapishka_5]MDX7950156.1 DUF2336 domain-containing protein [Lichenihabitans sp. Uapishka_5]
MQLHRFHQWVAAAPAQARAEAAKALIDAYGHIGADRCRAERLDRMVAVLLDDASVAVRRSLAEAAARSLDVPRWVVVALAQDDTPVATPVLAASALLSDADLVEAVATGDAECHCIVAARVRVPEVVAAAIVEAGHRDAVLSLLANATAVVTPCVLRRILHRFGCDAEMREALLNHAHQDPAFHHELVLAGTEALTRFALDCDWMSPARAESLRRETHDKSVVTIAAGCRDVAGPDGPVTLVMHLRSRGQLTPALLLRALLSGNLDLCEAALSNLSGIAPARCAGHMRAPFGLGFASLYAKAAMPAPLLAVFRAALQAVTLIPGRDGQDPALSRDAIGRVLEVCLSDDAPELARVAALMRRLEAEALREGARLVSVEQGEPMRHPAAPDIAVLRGPRWRRPVVLSAAA